MVHIFARKTGFEPSSKVGFSLGDPILDTMFMTRTNVRHKSKLAETGGGPDRFRSLLETKIQGKNMGKNAGPKLGNEIVNVASSQSPTALCDGSFCPTWAVAVPVKKLALPSE